MNLCCLLAINLARAGDVGVMDLVVRVEAPVVRCGEVFNCLDFLHGLYLSLRQERFCLHKAA